MERKDNNVQEVPLSARDNPQEAHDEYEVHWDEDDPLDPHSMTPKRKWAIVILVSSTTLCTCVASSVYTATYDQITVEFNCSRTVATLGLSLYIAGLGWGPIVMSSLSEFYGRRSIYLVPLPFFVIFPIPCAAARNTETMLVGRLFDGLAGAAFTSVAGATVDDMFSGSTLHTPMLVYTASPFTGASLGPVLGGLINSWASWRWSFYFLLIWASLQSILVMLFGPETYHPVLLRNRARKMRMETGDERWRAPIEKLDRSVLKTVIRSLYRLFLLLLLEPMCLNLCLLSAFALGVQYLLFGAFGVVFSNAYDFNLWQTGLAFVGLVVGMVLAVVIDPFCCRIYPHFSGQSNGPTDNRDEEPERRLPPAVLGAPLVTIVPWIVLVIGSAVFGTSVLGSNSCMRSTFAAAFPLFGVAMYHRLGNQWATSLLAFLSLVIAPFP
ncbi:major facilitator superfamily domain-containing protein [Aspergillus germanicus]